MRIFYTNRIDASGVVITGSSAISTLPASNVAHEFREKPWRTGTSTALEAVVFDLGAAATVLACIIFDHTLTAGDSLIKVQGNTADSWGAPAFEQALTYSSGPISAVFASQNYRYWRVTFTKSAAGQQRDIGRIFLGPYYDVEEDPDYQGYTRDREDLSRKQRALGGQTFTELLPQFERLKLAFSHISTTMQTSLRTYVSAVGQSVAHFVQVSTSSPFDDILYVKLARAWSAKAAAMDTSPVWDTSLEYEEQL